METRGVDDAERLDAALNRRRIGASVEDLPAALRALVELALEVGDACSAAGLTGADRERIYAAAWAGAGLDQRRLLTWPPHLSRSQAAILGGAAALTALAAAIGVRAIVVRRGQRVHLAAA